MFVVLIMAFAASFATAQTRPGPDSLERAAVQVKSELSFSQDLMAMVFEKQFRAIGEYSALGDGLGKARRDKFIAASSSCGFAMLKASSKHSQAEDSLYRARRQFQDCRMALLSGFDDAAASCFSGGLACVDEARTSVNGARLTVGGIEYHFDGSLDYVDLAAREAERALQTLRD